MAVSARGLVGLLVVVVLLQVSSRTVLAEPDSILVQILGSRYTGLVKLFEEANLLADLETEEHFAEGVTIFAPSDHYLLDKVSPTLLSFLSQPGNIEHLRKVLLHHIVPGKLSAKYWYPGETVKTLAGADAKLYLEDGELKVNGVVVKELGVLEADDGMVHAINGFLVPEDIMAAAEAEAAEASRRELIVSGVNLQSAAAPAPAPSSAPIDPLVSALTAAGNYTSLLTTITNLNLIPVINGLLESGQEITIIAPDDSAFADVAALSQLSSAQLTEIILYHVVVDEYSFTELAALVNGSIINTVSNLTIAVRTVAAADGLPTVYFNDALIVVPDLVAGVNGASVQGVESVLLPPTLVLPPTPSPGAPVTGTPPPASTAPPAPPPPASAGVQSAVISWMALAFAAVAGIALVL